MKELDGEQRSQISKSGGSGLGKFRVAKPVSQTRKIDGGSYSEMLKSGLGIADKASSTQFKGTNGLGDSAFDASPQGIAFLELRLQLVNALFRRW